MGKKYIAIEEAQTVYERIVKEYVSPKFDGETLVTLPKIDFALTIYFPEESSIS